MSESELSFLPFCRGVRGRGVTKILLEHISKPSDGSVRSRDSHTDSGRNRLLKDAPRNRFAHETDAMSSPAIDTSPAPWMPWVLRAAGVYNLAWAAFAIVAPASSLRLAGFSDEKIIHPLWQGMGLLIGLFGVGYWLSARNPYQNWLAIFVGFLGKVLGPIGLIGAMVKGDISWRAAPMMLPNDLIWWFPLGIILWQAAVWHDSQSAIRAEGSAMRTLRGSTGQTLEELSSGQRVLVVFLRHSGCTFCREALADLARLRSQIESSGARLALVSMTGEEDFRPFAEQYQLGDLPRFSDPQRQLYQEFELSPGSPLQLLSPQVWIRGFLAVFRDGHGFASPKESAFQMPGTFLIEDGRILRSHKYKTAADRPDYAEMSCPLPR